MLDSESLKVGNEYFDKFWKPPNADIKKNILQFVKQRFFTGPVGNWYEGREWCKKQGGSLATIYSQAEYEWAKSICWSAEPFRGAFLSIYACWLGLNDIKQEGIWRNANGLIMRNIYGFTSDGSTQMGLSPWLRSAPQVQNGDCVKLVFNSRYADGTGYEDTNCDKFRFMPICQPSTGEFPMIVRHRYGDLVDKYLDNINIIRNSLFFVGPEIVTWNTAKTFCEDNNGKLATVQDSNQFEQVQNLCKRVVVLVNDDIYREVIHGGCWVAMNDINEEGIYTDSNGDKLNDMYGIDVNGKAISNVTPWFTGRNDRDHMIGPQPDNTINSDEYGHDEDCVMLGVGYQFEYIDVNCGKRGYPICQYNTEPDISNINDDERIINEMNNADRKLQDSLRDSSKDLCIKKFEYKGLKFDIDTNTTSNKT